ncbi:MAG: VWA domain-containing protein [Gemmatimonadota bacterium]|nr:VWA domain-containing protein [Gemmatimonadota bacterium]MDH5758195.1 VWA domain-containing protein [Gemmatimonadota bacterium]
MSDLRWPWMPAVALAGILLVSFLRSRGAAGVSWSHPGGALPLASRRARLAAYAPGVARALSVCVLAWAASGWTREVALPGERGSGAAIMVVLDVSESMSDPGLGRRRKLDAALAELIRFVEGRDGDLVGLVVFAGEAVIQVPPMLDRRPLLAAARSVRGSSLKDGTAMGTALGLAADRLRSVEARSRVVVLLTDGESNAGVLDPLTAAAAAAALGIRIHALDVASGADGPSRLDEVARVGGGRHFVVGDREGLDRAYAEIDALEPTRFEEAHRRTRVSRHAGLLWWALGLLALERGILASPWGRLP